MKTEIRHDMPFDEYAASPGMNASALKVGAASGMAVMREYIENGRPDSPSLAFGRMVHTAVLEPEKVLSRLVVWEGGRKAGKAWDAFKADNAEKEIVTGDQRDALETIAMAVRSHGPARDLVDEAAHEVSLFWKHKIIGDCKARPDLLGINCGLCDVKTTMADTAEAFGVQCARLGYGVQLGWYINGCAGLDLYGPDIPVHVIAIRNKPPFRVAVLRVPQQVIDAGQDTALEVATKYRACEACRSYEWIADGDLYVPPWAGGAVELDMTGLEEDSGNE